VDHGKSTLIKALTGIDPDRLKEEKERQMTIELGFAWFKLPSGNEVGIVDVPGHRDFVENMLAGVGGIDAVLLVIAADEGIMPQTREHISILKLLRIKQGMIVLTKCDLVDAEWLELMEADIRSFLGGTFLATARLVRTSALSGEGLDELARAMDEMLSGCPPKRDNSKARLPVDRVFSLKGFGTVVTGTLLDGSLQSGQLVEILPSKKQARIRSLQTHQKKVDTAPPGNRTALNLSGVDLDEVQRGNVVAVPGGYQTTRRIAASVEMLADASGAIRHDDELKCFMGTAQMIGRARVIGSAEIKPGETGWLQLEFPEAVAAEKGDRFILRRPSPQETIAGGQIVEAVSARRYKRFSDEVLARLALLESGSSQQIILERLREKGLIELQALADECGLDEDTTRREIAPLLGGEIAALSTEKDGLELLASREYWEGLRKRITGLLEEHYKKYPLQSGMPKKTLSKELKLEQKTFNLALQALAREGMLVNLGSEIGLAEHQVSFSVEDEAQIAQVLALLRQTLYAPPALTELADSYPADLLNAMAEKGMLVKVTEDMAFLPEVYEEVLSRTRAYLEREGQITLAQFRDMFQNSRKYALALLEHLDEMGMTERQGEARVLKGKEKET